MFVGKPVRTWYGIGYYLGKKGEHTIVTMGRAVKMYLGPAFVYPETDQDEINAPDQPQGEVEPSWKCLLF